MNKLNIVMMAFGATKEATDSVVKRYVGVAPVYIKAVNPTKKELEDFYGITLDKDPEYVSVNSDGKKQVRVDFLVQTTEKVKNEKGEPLNLKTKISYFLVDEERKNRDGSGLQVINAYGNSTFIPKVNFDNKTMPENQSWFETDGLRVAFTGEADVTDLIKKYLGIPNVSYRNKEGQTVYIDNKSDAECRFEHIADWFKGDFSELKEAVALQPNSRIKICFGVKTAQDGKQYQDVYTKCVLKNGTNDYSKLLADINGAKANGSYPNTVFDVCELKEYVVESTNFNEPSSSVSAPNPWGN